MKKLELLRAHLFASVPALRDDPTRLLTYIERGRIRFRRSAVGPQNLSHEYVAPVTLIILDWTDPLDSLIVPLLAWLSHYQPDLAEDALDFDAEIHTSQSADLSLTVALTERVSAHGDCDTGQIHLTHRLPEYPSSCAATHWQLYLRGPAHPAPVLIAEWDTLTGEDPSTQPDP